ncbi:MAG: hypothetical protein IJV06_07885 [Bacteroidaceae bacterium]|nr:hypothetical protein [Bacteroidaceae bacterium]
MFGIKKLQFICVRKKNHLSLHRVSHETQTFFAQIPDRITTSQKEIEHKTKISLSLYFDSADFSIDILGLVVSLIGIWQVCAFFVSKSLCILRLKMMTAHKRMHYVAISIIINPLIFQIL